LEPLIINPNDLNFNYSKDVLNIEFANKAIELLDKNIVNSDPIVIDDQWISLNIISFLRASSLIFSRETTHRYWTSLYSFNSISPFCIALDALCGGISYRSVGPKYVYVDANKESWSKDWMFIYYMELMPTATEFLIERNISYDKKDFKIKHSDYVWFAISLLNNFKKLFLSKYLFRLIKYAF
jgi:hypothetical protein